jgi:AcrR family transcriptional regulator
VDVGVELARADGPAAVVLREAARRLEISPAAAYRHFHDKQDLLLAVRREALSALGQRMVDSACRSDPLLRFRDLGETYVRFALDEPGLFRTLAAPGVPVGPGQAAADPDPFGLLSRALDDMVDGGVLRAGRRPHADAVAWAAVHGLAALLIDGLLPRHDAGVLIDRALDVVANGLLPDDAPDGTCTRRPLPGG